MKLKVNMEFKFIISLLFSVLVAIFAIQNARSVEINFLFTKFTISQAVVILGSAVIGALIVLLLGIIKQIKQGVKIKQLKKEIEIITEERNKLQANIDEYSISSIEEEKKIECNNEKAILENEDIIEVQ
ncbi:LapA family protein [Tissierella pigra]|uniref:LapA family protein n=1 Tax=Tissierella pigra TaxID=2607614 RepID=A0A6N7XN67_9FIRM|nr:LapA family protein [Tissierella pigra]MBU5427755.1 LapA family protein [Tissierella pigra]MSU03499.1 LapA family protein [Tissierella pigra]